jgi:hypothetical protein
VGFDVVEPLSVMQGPSLNLEIPGHSVRAATADDIKACDDLHYRLHGFIRGSDLQMGISQDTAAVVEHEGRISGFTSNVGFSGFSVGETNEDIKALIGAAPAFQGSGFLLPTRNSELFRWCLSHGLRVVYPATLMSMGLYKDPSGSFLSSILF